MMECGGLENACGVGRLVTEHGDDPVLFREDKEVALTEPVWEGWLLCGGCPSSRSDKMRCLA